MWVSSSVLLCCMMFQASEPATGPGDEPVIDDPVCEVDERLSLALSLESVDRTIAALEAERRQLVVELAKTQQLLDVLKENHREDVPVGELGALVAAKAAGYDALREAYSQAELRLVEIDGTLERRRSVQAELEAGLNALLEPSPTAGTDPEAP